MTSSGGRPRGDETRRRTTELLRLLSVGSSLEVAAREARVKPERVLKLMSDPQFRAAAVMLLDQQAA